MDKLEQQIKDLEFLLKREKIENKTKIKDILCQILDIYDNFERLIRIALNQNWPDDAKKFVSERFSLIGKKMIQEIERAGAIQINSLGEKYNEEYHEVITFKYMPDLPEGQIIEVQNEGFLFEGDIIRMAKVVVSTMKKE